MAKTCITQDMKVHTIMPTYTWLDMPGYFFRAQYSVNSTVRSPIAAYSYSTA